MTKRAIHLDAVGGLLIIWMIFVHIQSLTQCVLIRNRYMPLLFCFMAWFFYKAGMFYREKPLREELYGIWKRLLIPYIFFSVVGAMCGFVIECVLGTESVPHYLLRSAGQVVKWGGVTSNMPIWFLLSLAVVRMIIQFVHKYHLVYPVTGVALLSSYLLFKMSVFEPCYLGNISLGLFFFGIGYLLKDYQYNRIMVIVATVVYIVFFVFFPSNVDFRANLLTSGNYSGYVITAVLAIIILNNLFKVVPFLCIRSLVHIGEHSMVYYLCHWPLITLCIGFIRHWSSQSNLVLCIISITICLVCLPLLDKVFQIERIKKYIGE